MGDVRKNMRINCKINDAATPSGKQSAQKDTPESIWTHANIQAFSANCQTAPPGCHPPSVEKLVVFFFFFFSLSMFHRSIAVC